MKLLSISTKKYLGASLVIMLVNVGLGAYLYSTTFAQSSDLMDQQPLRVEVLLEHGSPLRVVPARTDVSAKDFQTVYLDVHNASPKPVRAYSLLERHSNGIGRSLTSYFYPPFRSATDVTHSFMIERTSIKPELKTIISLDFVQFADGTVWGEDVGRQSDLISGHLEGYDQAVLDFTNRLSKKNEVELSALFRQNVTDVVPSKPIVSAKTEVWERGFMSGYRSVFFKLKRAMEQDGIAALDSKLDEIRSSGVMGGKREEW